MFACHPPDCYASRMIPPRGMVSRIIGAVQRLAAKIRPRAMIGVPPSARPMWHDPAAHARDFAERYAHDLDLAVALRMRALRIHDDQIGMSDRIAGIDWAAFHPHGTEGGNNSPEGGLIVDSGVLNLDLLTKNYGIIAADLFAKSRLRDRLDAIIAHEYEEHRHSMDHEAALRHAPKTELPISERPGRFATQWLRGGGGR
jgi:hypothetical protein